jgi:hypothetical protein
MRARVEEGGERYWRHTDFPDLPPAAVVQALHRLERANVVSRVRKGLYYRGRETAFGPSIPSAADLAALGLHGSLQPAGLTAANALGFTTQNPARPEYATSRPNPPTGIAGAVIHTRRPLSRSRLTAQEGAILEFLRERGRTSDLGSTNTIRRLLKLLREGNTFARVAAAASDEPPRVRAMLGALGEEMGANPVPIARLRQSLNPLSRFDFGLLRSLRHARDWQAK